MVLLSKKVCSSDAAHETLYSEPSSVYAFTSVSLFVSSVSRFSQDLAARHAAPSGVAEDLERANGVIYRTNLCEGRETAVIFPSKKSGANTFEVCFFFSRRLEMPNVSLYEFV